MSFSRCYTPCPICQPARAAFWSSRYPSEVDVLSNGRRWPVSSVDTVPTLGETFANAGYETVHIGKKHDSGALRGFKCYPELETIIPDEHRAFPLNMDSYADRYTTDETVKYLNRRTNDNQKPYLLIADLINPHNICGWVGENKFKHENIPLPEGYSLPPLPENFEFNDIINRPKGVQYICCSHIRQSQTVGWDEMAFRHYLAAYYYYIELLDKEIGRILDALDKSGEKNNTMIVFFADHGDSMAARGMVTKQVNFYEEVSRVPFLFSAEGITQKNVTIDEVVSTLDLFPTLCGYAGIEIPVGLRGVDLSGIFEGKKNKHRKYIASQWHTEWGYTVSPGRMICTNRYKYTYYIEDNLEELFDLANDPYEITNVANIDEYSIVLDEMRHYFKEYIKETGDNFLNMEWIADEKWRSHTLGYQNHHGISAPEQ